VHPHTDHLKKMRLPLLRVNRGKVEQRLHHQCPALLDFLRSRRNRSLVERSGAALEGKGYTVLLTAIQDGYDVDVKIEKQLGTDALIL